MATTEKKKIIIFNEKEHLHYAELLIKSRYYDRGDLSFLEEIKIKLSGRKPISDRQKKYLTKISQGTSINFKTDALKKWEINRVGKIVRANIGDSLILIIFKTNLERKLKITSSEWDYFWNRSDELLQKDREGVGITDQSSRPTP